MLNKQDKIWLSQKYPKLVISKDNKRVSEKIEFIGTYNEKSGRFLQIEKDTIDGVGGLRLSGQFIITIECRTNVRDSKLPALSIEKVDPTLDRHFNQTDFTACVCNPLEEDEFIGSQFSFQKYFEKLVIPFLYGQLFFDQPLHLCLRDSTHLE